jgi:hypothetical protein
LNLEKKAVIRSWFAESGGRTCSSHCHTYRPSFEFFLLIGIAMTEVPGLNLLTISANKIPISCSCEYCEPHPLTCFNFRKKKSSINFYCVIARPDPQSFSIFLQDLTLNLPQSFGDGYSFASSNNLLHDFVLTYTLSE